MSARVFLPADSSALSVGADAVAKALAREAAKRGMALTVVRTGTRGLFWLEPLIEVEGRGGRVAYGPVEPREVGSLFEAGFLDGGAHPKSLGRVDDIPYFARQQRLVFSRCGATDPLSLDDYRLHGGLRGLERALSLGPKTIIDEVLVSGLRGRGGAGFPTGIKWRTVAGVDADRKYVVCNADEGDSGTFADRMLMEGDPFLLIEGMTIAALSVGATIGYVYIRSEYPHAFTTFSRAIERARAAGLLGTSVLGSGHPFDLEARLGAGAYICGEETSLLESLEGKRGQVRAKPPLPAISGSVRQADRHQQRIELRLRRRGYWSTAARPMLTTGSAARSDRSRSSLPATSATEGWSSLPSARQFAISSKGLAAERARAVRFGRFRSAVRSAPISRRACSTRRSTTKSMLAAKGMLGPWRDRRLRRYRRHGPAGSLRL